MGYKSTFGAGLVAAGLYGLIGCTTLPTIVELPKQEQKKIETIDYFVQTFFTQEAREALKDSPLYVAKHELSKALYGKIPAGTYLNSNRFIDKIAYERAQDVEDILFHETIHYLTDAGLIDKGKFMEVYDKIKDAPLEIPPKRTNEEIAKIGKGKELSTDTIESIISDCSPQGFSEQRYFPIKKEVESIILEYDPKKSDLVSERIAYLAELWKMDGYEIPAEMEAVFCKMIIPHQKKGFIRGLVGQPLR